MEQVGANGWIQNSGKKTIMPPSIALLLTIIFILCLFALDFKRKPNVSYGLWIPLIWMLIIGSRPVSLWLSLATPIEHRMDYLEGSPIDRTAFLVLIIVGLLILLRRRVSWSRIGRANALIVLFIAYCGVSVLWSDFAFVSLKRWIKEVGTLIMILVVLSDPDRNEAVKAIFRRCGYVLVPLSVLFIKYYPNLGRGYSPWSWYVYYVGVSIGKNSLGALCLVLGLFFVWDLLTGWRKRSIVGNKQWVLVHMGLLMMTLWLFAKADSASSLMCFIIGVCVILVAQMRMFRENPKSILRYMVVVGLIMVFYIGVFDMQKFVFEELGRSKTLTGRTDMWNQLLNAGIDPFIGTGYESFWLADRAAVFMEGYYFHLNQAHNGYLEIYLNLGVIGLVLLFAVVVSVFRKIRKGLMINLDFGVFGLVVLIMVLLHNIAEASFGKLGLMWFVLLLVGMEVPRLTKFGISDEKMIGGHDARGG